jgi:hypothetical protein
MEEMFTMFSEVHDFVRNNTVFASLFCTSDFLFWIHVVLRLWLNHRDKDTLR